MIFGQGSGGSEYPERLALWHSHPPLCAVQPPASATAQLAAMSDAALAVAAENPDHSEAGRRMARETLRARNGAARPPPLVAPGFLSPADVGAAVPRGLRGRERWLQWIGGVLGIVLTLYLFGALFPATERERERALAAAHAAGVLGDVEFARRDVERPDGSYETYGARDILRRDVAPYATGYRQAMRTSAFVLALVFAAACTWFAGLLFRRAPARILLLRKFNNREVDDHLRRFVARHLSPVGHVFVLADRYYRRQRLTLLQVITIYPMLLRILRYGYYSPAFWAAKLVLIPWDLLRGRLNRSSAGGAIRISDAKGYRRFGERIPDRIACNAQVMANARQSVIVRTSDDWWQHAIALLMQSADLIVVDLSDVTQGTEWELDQIVERQLLGRTVFIVRADAISGLEAFREDVRSFMRTGRWHAKIRSEEAQRAFARMGLDDEAAAIVYDKIGRTGDLARLHDWMRAALREGTGAKP